MQRPPIPAPPFLGGCLCGHVRFRLDARPKGVHACHCKDCKKLSGTSHIIVAVAGREAFTHETGEVRHYRKRADSGRDVDLVYCAACGVRLWHEPQSAPDLIIASAGTFDDPSWIVPAAHIWVQEEAPDFSFAPGALKVRGQPQGRQVLFDAFAKLYPEEL